MAPLLALAALTALPLAESPRAKPRQARPADLPAIAGGTAIVRIVTPALVGKDLGAPRAGMVARAATLSVPEGPVRTLLVYDFE